MPSRRSIVLPLLSLITILCLIYLYSGWAPQRSALKGYPNRLSSSANVAPPSIVAFWAQWARIIRENDPKIAPIEIVWNANPSMPKGKGAEGERSPTPQRIGLKKEDVEALRNNHSRFVTDEEFKRVQEEARTIYDGTGIVMVAGGALVPPAILGIRMLRKTGSTLPVQIFMLAEEFEQEICEDTLPELGAECYIIEDFPRQDQPFEVRSYQLKPLAMLFSFFSSVILLDADCFPLLDPAELVVTEPFTTTGLVTWPDYWAATEDPIFYTIAGLDAYPTGLPIRSSESGQLLIDKTRHLKTLLLATYYNVYGPGCYYQILSQGAPGEGDKETFLAAATVLGEPVHAVRQKPSALGYRETRSDEWHGGAIVQSHPGDDLAKNMTKEEEVQMDVRPFFIHASTPKLNARELVYDDNLLFMPESGERIRIWGKQEDNEKRIGYDFERTVWEELVDMACTLQPILRDWRGKSKLCKKAKEHFSQVFDD